MKPNKNSLAERVFGAEANSAAAIDEARLAPQRELAAKLFNTRVLRPKEMAYPAVAELANSILNVVSSYRALYFVNVLKIDMLYVTAILTLISIWDVLNDPLMGMLYDKTRTRWGKSRPYLIFTPIPYFISTAVLYSGALFLTNDNTADPGKIVFVFVMLFVQETFSTIYHIPRGNMTSLMSPNPTDRITLGIVMTYVQSVAAQFFYAIMLPIIDINSTGKLFIPMPLVFATLAWLGAITGAVGNMSMAFGCRERLLLQPKPAPITKSMFYILKNKYELRNFIVNFLTGFWSDGGYSWTLVVEMELYGGTMESAIAWTPWFILDKASIAFIPAFRRFFKNNKTALISLRMWDFLCGMTMAILGPFLVENKWMITGMYTILEGLQGANNGPGNVFEGEIVREIRDYTEYVTGERPDGTMWILSNLLMKLTSPLNALMTIAVFRWTGYDPTIPMGFHSQGNMLVYKKVFFLWQAFTYIPMMIRTIPYFFYDLVGEKREDMYLALNERRALVANQQVNEDLLAVMGMLHEEREENDR